MNTSTDSRTVSVIIPTYNRAHCIGQAITSALAQSVRDIEVLVVDDGSRDDTERVVRAIPDTRVRYVAKTNGGCSSARNFGIAHASGRYLAFLDSDDSWDTDWLATSTAIMDKDSGIGAVYGSLLRETVDGEALGTLDLSLGGRHAEATVAYVLSQCMGLLGSNVIARREAIDRIGGWDESFPTAGDLEFGLRLASECRVALVASPMIHLRETVGSLSKNVNTGNRLRVLDLFAARRPDLANRHSRTLRRSRARILCSYADDLLSLGRIREGEERLVASLRTSLAVRPAWLLLKAQLLKLRGLGATRPAN